MKIIEEYKARALTGEVVYGNFIHSKRFAGCFNEYRIHEPKTGLEHDININTLNRFTGLYDKNKKKIFTGHEFRYTKHKGILIESFTGTVVYDNERACYGYIDKNFPFENFIMPFCEFDDLKEDFLNHIEIIN